MGGCGGDKGGAGGAGGCGEADGGLENDGGGLENDGGGLENDGGGLEDDGGGLEDDGGGLKNDGGANGDNTAFPVVLTTIATDTPINVITPMNINVLRGVIIGDFFVRRTTLGECLV